MADQIEARIATGQYALGHTLPTEMALEQEFAVSRITVRRALSLLKRRGILSSRSGVGTFVRPGASDQKSMRISGSLNELIYYASETRYTSLGQKLVTPPLHVAKILEMNRTTKVFCFSGIRGRPRGRNFCFEAIYVPQCFGRNLDNTRLDQMPFFTRLEKVNGVKIAEVEQIITAVSAPASIARHLSTRKRAPMLMAVRVYRLGDGRIAEVVVSYYDPSRFAYIMKLFPE